MGVDIAQWIRPRPPYCGHGFESYANIVKLWIIFVVVLRIGTKINKKRAGLAHISLKNI